MDLELAGRVAIVTGGARGIGAAIARGFAAEGASVVIADSRIDLARDMAEKLAGSGAKAVAVGADVTRQPDAENLASTALREFGGIDILVNNAGVIQDLKFVDIEEKDWDRINDANVKGVYLITRAVVPHMIAAGYGKIVNISSLAGKRGSAGIVHYCASKFAVIGITQALAKELAEHDINVNAVCPGILPTAMWEVLLEARAKRQRLSRKRVWDRWMAQIPLGRPQTPEDIANLVLFLSSAVSRNITGEAININGGMYMD
jgi:NAD(P)-dependent dehydrogenase (short-subunit alcohol dehydrogenase family)